MKAINNSRTPSIVLWLMMFIIWPLGSFFASLKYIGKRQFSIILILFYGLYGFTFVLPKGGDADTERIAQYFFDSVSLSFRDLVSIISNLYTEKVNPDIFQDLLQFTVSRFTTNTHIYFAMEALLIGYFVSKILFILKKDQEVYVNNELVFFLLMFILVLLAPSRIGSFRHYFASVVFLYCTYVYLTLDNPKYLLFLLLIPPLIHFSYWLALPVIVLFKLLRNSKFMYYVLILLSFVFYEQTAQVVNRYSEAYEGYTISKKVQAYSSERYLRKVSDIKSKRIYILDKYIYFTCLGFLFISIFIFYRFKVSDVGIDNLLCLSLLMFFLINVFQSLESVSNRFGVIYIVVCCITFIRIFSINSIKAPAWLNLYLLAIIAGNSIIAFRLYIQHASVSSILVGLPLAIFEPLEITILEYFFK